MYFYIPIFRFYYSDPFGNDAEVRMRLLLVIERMISHEFVRAKINKKIDMFDRALGLFDFDMAIEGHETTR